MLKKKKTNPIAQLKLLWRVLKREKVHQLFLLGALVIIIGSSSFFIFEMAITKDKEIINKPLLSKYIDSLWWTCVTLTTVGYGDITPKTVPGRIAGVMVMFSGIVVMSLITAVIASILVERKIREDKGLESLKLSNHIVICGWNENAPDILLAIKQMKDSPKTVTLINDMEEDQINEIKYKNRGELDIHFIKGDFINESVLDRASITQAHSVILLSDISGKHERSKADERVILGTLTIKHMSEKVRVTAELIDRENESHLKRAHADEIVVRGKYSSFFLSNSALSPGVFSVMEGLVSLDPHHQVVKFKIPSKFFGHTFREVFDFARNEHKAILFAVISISKGVSFDDLLSDDLSAIDIFIKRKFEEAGADLTGSSDQVEVQINPPDDYRIKENDHGVILFSNI